MSAARDHGGRLDQARAKWGGAQEDWLDLSTGINPVPYGIGNIPADAWTRLPDSAAQNDLIDAARDFWQVPDHLEILAAPGASALIARLPGVMRGMSVDIPKPTYNEHAAAFDAEGWEIDAADADLRVLVHPNNPDGRIWTAADLVGRPTIVDESFCDVSPESSLIRGLETGSVVLKSFGKFWGLAGLRLGFAIGHSEQIEGLREALGPWPVSGPALHVGAEALRDAAWADQTRERLDHDARRMDDLMTNAGAEIVGGTTLFRLYQVDNAQSWHDKLAEQHIFSRIFPYSETWIRLGLPAPDQWTQLERAL